MSNNMAPFYKIKIISNAVSTDPNKPDTSNAAQLIDISDRVIEFSYDDKDDKLDAAKFTIDNRDLQILDTGLLFSGTSVVFVFGYPGRFTSRAMIIDGISGFERLEVSCVDRALANNKAKTRHFKNLPYERVVEVIFNEMVGISPDQRLSTIDKLAITDRLSGDFAQKSDFKKAEEIRRTKSTLVSKFLGQLGLKGFKINREGFKGLVPRDFNQAGQSNIQFLYRLAEKIGYVIYTKDGFLIFSPREFDGNPTRTFTYMYGEGDVLEFSVDKFTIVDEPAETTVKARDPINRTNNSEKGSDKETSRKTINQRSIFKLRGDTGSGKVEFFAASNVVPSPDPSRSSNKKEADSHFIKAKENEVHATLVVIGDPTLKASQMIILEGFSKMFSGKWYISGAEHSVSQSGYKTTLKLIRGGVSTKAPKDDDKKTQTSQTTQKRLKGDFNSGQIVLDAKVVGK